MLGGCVLGRAGKPHHASVRPSESEDTPPRRPAMSHAANYCCAQLPEGKELGEVLRGRLAVLRVSAKNPAALQQAGSSAQLPYAFVQCDETQLHVLVFQSELARAETELKRVASGNKALACKLQRLGADAGVPMSSALSECALPSLRPADSLGETGDLGDMDPVACVSWALTSRFPGLHCGERGALLVPGLRDRMSAAWCWNVCEFDFDHSVRWFEAGAEYRDSDSAQTHTFLFEKEQLVREPSLLAELPEGSGGAFWSEGATLRISCERNLRVAFEAIRTRVSPVNLNKVCCILFWCILPLSFAVSLCCSSLPGTLPPVGDSTTC